MADYVQQLAPVSMLKKSTAMEYKLHRTVLSKEDFISYIQYEINVLELIKKRRARIGYHFKREEIEHSIIHGIISVFRRATSKWQEDVQLWLSHIAFSKKWLETFTTENNTAVIIWAGLWIMAAKCQMEDCGSSESARHLFLRALRFHPENKKVYQEYFRMELMHAEKLRKQQEELERAKMDVGEYEFSPEILSGKLAEVVYRNATQKIKGVYSAFSSPNQFKCILFRIEDLQTEHTDDSVTWDFMARRELDAAGAPELQDARGRASDANRREERCCAVYEEGVKNLNTEPMWMCYVTFCLDRFKRKTNISELKEKRKERLLGVFQRAHDASMLQESFYKTWLQVLLSSGETESAAQVAIEATKRFSQSVETWHLSLQTLVSLERVEAGLLFQEALNHVNPKDSLPLWQLQAEWSMVSQTQEETEALFQVKAAADVPAISTALKETYLEWAFKTGGYKKARKTFKSLHEHRPFTKTFFTKMVQIEKEQENPKISNLRDYYERALREFGSSDDGEFD
uniref:UTP6 small subunit processome component n=1 Tax=Astyanax mexicanus TaxID=7994 RepID=A0A8B9LQ05_ASTMX